MNQAQCLTSCIVHLADSAKFKGVTSNKLCNGLTVSCFESPNDTIHVTVMVMFLFTWAKILKIINTKWCFIKKTNNFTFYIVQK